MIMKKHFHTIPILLVIILQMIGPRAAVAGDIEWQIHWQDNSVLQEEIRISGPDFITTDRNWKVSQEGDLCVLRREVENWQNYGKMKDRLPLKVQSRNYFVYKKYEIMTAPETAAGLFQQLNDGDNLSLNISVPGIITGGSGERIDESSAKWIFSNRAELLREKKLMTFITADGLLLGIGILLLGLLFVVINFIKRLKKVNKIIEEEYSVTKIKQDHQKEGE